MKKNSYYKEQAEKFRDYANKNPDRELLSLFEEWCDSKDIFGEDKYEIWKKARRIRASKPLIIEEGSEEFVRVSAVLDILLEHDLMKLRSILEKKKWIGEGKNDLTKLDN